MTPPVDFESWSEVSCSGSLVGSQIDLRMAKTGRVSLTLNTHFEGDQGAWQANKGMTNRI